MATGCVTSIANPWMYDLNSPNFNPYATEDDGTCLVGGCTVPVATESTIEADYLLLGALTSSCVGCLDVNACNYDPTALVPNLNLCTYPGDLRLRRQRPRTTSMEMACV